MDQQMERQIFSTEGYHVIPHQIDRTLRFLT
jgi:hypothetical protein